MRAAAILIAALAAGAACPPARAGIGGAVQPPVMSDVRLTPTDGRTAWGGEQLAREFNQLPDRKAQLGWLAYLAAGGRLHPAAWQARHAKYRAAR